MNRESSVVRYSHYNFNEEAFFKDILIYLEEKRLIDEDVLEKIYYERMELLKEKLKYYTKNESSSVMFELAESTLKSIDYTIGIYLKTIKNIEDIIEKLKSISFLHILEKGQEEINKKMLYSKKLLQKISEGKLKIDNYSYNDTIDYGLPLFFKEYNYFFAAHEAAGSIDYQLCIDNTNYVGIEYIYNYLTNLNLENDFSNNFGIAEINKLLKGYDKKCELLLINVFELLLINCIGVILCDRDLKSININNFDREYIKSKLGNLSFEQLQEQLLKYAKMCWEALNIDDKALINYIKKSTIKVTSLINQSIKLNKLDTVFITLNKEDTDGVIYYNDGEKMKNSTFKLLSEEIRECSLVENKITLIKNNIKSLEDLVDILSADCLFDKEFISYFEKSSHMEIALLTKYIYELGYEREWCSEFNKYILSLSEMDQILIKELTERIVIS
jgi:hypothetical protein